MDAIAQVGDLIAVQMEDLRLLLSDEMASRFLAMDASVMARIPSLYEAGVKPDAFVNFVELLPPHFGALILDQLDLN